MAESEGAERQLRELTERRTQKQETLAGAKALVENLERLASQATCRSVAAEQVRLAKEVLRIRKIGTDVEAAEGKVAELVRKITGAEQALTFARGQKAEASAALEAAEGAARAEGSDPGVTDTVVRQQLEIRKSAAEQAAREAQQRIDAALVDNLAPLTLDELRKIDAYWHACNYLAAGMIYLRANPLLREPLMPEHIKNRLLGHWGSDPGQSFIWIHLNRLIKKYDLSVMYIAGPTARRPRWPTVPLKATIPRSIPTRVVTKLACSSSSSSFRFPAGSAHTARRKHPVRFNVWYGRSKKL